MPGARKQKRGAALAALDGTDEFLSPPQSVAAVAPVATTDPALLALLGSLGKKLESLHGKVDAVARQANTATATGGYLERVAKAVDDDKENGGLITAGQQRGNLIDLRSGRIACRGHTHFVKDDIGCHMCLDLAEGPRDRCLPWSAPDGSLTTWGCTGGIIHTSHFHVAHMWRLHWRAWCQGWVELSGGAPELAGSARGSDGNRRIFYNSTLGQ